MEFDGSASQNPAQAKLMGRLEKFAEKIMGLDSPIIRFHADADGISSGILVRKFIKGKSMQNDFSHYKAEHAERDALEGRAVLLLDFGSNEESAKASQKILPENLFVIDHHPITTPLQIPNLVSPYSFGLDSRFTSGWMVGEMAKYLGKGETKDVEFFQQVSLAGDRSGLVKHSEEAEKLSVAFDYIASSMRISLSTYESMYRNGSWEGFYLEAKGLISEAVSRIEKTLKAEQIGKFAVIAFPIETKKFPSKGKIAQELLKRERNSCIVIPYDKKYITFRSNNIATANGFDGGKLISSLKEENPNAIIFGGGHPNAASMKVGENLRDFMLQKIKEKISKI